MILIILTVLILLTIYAIHKNDLRKEEKKKKESDEFWSDTNWLLKCLERKLDFYKSFNDKGYSQSVKNICRDFNIRVYSTSLRTLQQELGCKVDGVFCINDETEKEIELDLRDSEAKRMYTTLSLIIMHSKRYHVLDLRPTQENAGKNTIIARKDRNNGQSPEWTEVSKAVDSLLISEDDVFRHLSAKSCGTKTRVRDIAGFFGVESDVILRKLKEFEIIDINDDTDVYSDCYVWSDGKLISKKSAIR